MIEYLIESTVCLFVFYLVFQLFYKGARNYQMNRVVLLFSVLFSVLVPLCHFSMPFESIQEPISISQFTTEIIPIEESMIPPSLEITDSQSISFDIILLICYVLGAIIFLSRFLFNLYRLLVKINNSEKGNYLGFEVVIFEEKISPFTFFRAICINKGDHQDQRLERELLVHETAHKHQLHSMDVVLLEFLQAIFWFNPLIYLFKRLIKINHEYLADEYVLISGVSSKAYANKLLHHTFPGRTSNLASGFNHLIIKQRLVMLSKFQIVKPKAYRFLLLVPIVFILFTTTAFTNNIVPEAVSSIQGDDDELLTPGVLYASTIFWSSEDSKVYLIGKNVRVKHGSNNVTVNGRASYLGEVPYLIFNGEPVKKNTSIDIEGRKCRVIKLTGEMARERYGNKGKRGAIEITVIQ